MKYFIKDDEKDYVYNFGWDNIIDSYNYSLAKTPRKADIFDLKTARKCIMLFNFKEYIKTGFIIIPTKINKKTHEISLNK